MPIAVLYPQPGDASAAERYGNWRMRAQLRRVAGVAQVIGYDPEEPARDVAVEIDQAEVLVVLDPAVMVDDQLVESLSSEFHRSPPGTVLSVALANEPALYLCATQALAKERRTLRRAVEGRQLTPAAAVVAVRREEEPDLLPFIPAEAKSVLHVRCGDGALGERIKSRQRCRVVGIEPERYAASIAKRRIDDVYRAAVAEVVSIVTERFDCIVATSVVEQTVDPWSLLADLRALASPQGVLVTVIPNVGRAAIVRGLLDGEFPVAAQVRHFTRASATELLEFAGWAVERIETVADVAPTASSAVLPATSPDVGARSFIFVARNTA